MFFPSNNQVWFYRHPTDFRRQIDGLVILVADKLQKVPTSGQLFVFRNRQADKIKILIWEVNGFWLLYKRIERGRFKFPGISDEVMELTTQELQWLLSGIDVMQQPKPKNCTIPSFIRLAGSTIQ